MWLSLALYGQLRGAAEAAGVSLQEWVEGAVRERVEREAGPRREPDWDSIFAAGRAAKASGPVMGRASLYEPDPLGEIA